MFDFIRNHKKIMQVLLLILIFPSFVLFGIDGYKRFNSKSEVVASVDGVDITQEEWDRAHQNEVNRMRASMPNVDNATFDTPAIKNGVLERMVQTRVLEAGIKKLNLMVSDPKVTQAIFGMEVLSSIKKEDGSLDLDKYRQLLAAQGMTPEMFEARMRTNVAVSQLVSGVVQSSVSFPSQNRPLLDAFLQQREVQVAVFSASDFLANAKPSEEDILKYFEAHKEQFKSPESADIEYVVLSLDAIEKTISVSESDLKTYFDQNQNTLAGKEERRASHILINAPKDMSAADLAKAKEKASAILETVKKNPAQFADIAKKQSQDPGSASQGGDLGFFAKGAMVKPFEDAAFSLKKGEISGLVQSDFGFHIIQLNEIKGGASASFQQLRPTLEAELKKQMAQKKFAEWAESFSNMVYEQSDSFKPVADKFKIAIQTANQVSRDASADPKLPWSNANVLKSLFSMESVKQGKNIEALEIAPNTLLSARILKHQPATYLSLAEIKPVLVQTVLAENALSMAKKEGADKLGIWKQKPDQGSWQAAVVISRDQTQKLPAALVEEALRANPSQLPFITGVDLGEKGYGIVKVNKVIPPTESTSQPADWQKRFSQTWTTAENLAYYAYLKQALKTSVKGNIKASATNLN